jgi:hypothetical protein
MWKLEISKLVVAMNETKYAAEIMVMVKIIIIHKIGDQALFP